MLNTADDDGHISMYLCVQLQHLVTDVTCVQLMDLFHTHQQQQQPVTSSQQLRSAAAEAAYQRKAEQLLSDENCFKLMLVSCCCYLQHFTFTVTVR